jgi:hypothetical protein
MNQASAGEGDELGLLVAPPGQDLGPLPRTSDLVRLDAREDNAAVDDARHDRRLRPGRRRHHRLVEQT